MVSISRNVTNLVIATIFISIIGTSEAVKCYQCGSDEDGPDKDNCGAYTKFDRISNRAVECNSEDSHMPGSFCMKVTQQSPKGFIWDGRWRQVIRRCASVADTGVTGVCNWGVYENGIYWEECYCSEDECNAANVIELSKVVSLMSLGLVLLWQYLSFN